MIEVPALTVGGRTIVSVFEETALAHGAFPVAVNVSVTPPAVISAALGVYTGVKVVPFVKVPDPEVVQFTPVLLAAVAPVIFTDAIFEQVD